MIYSVKYYNYFSENHIERITLNFSKFIKLASFSSLLILTCTSSINLEVTARPQSQELKPEELYQIVQTMVYSYYLDPSFNNQDLSIWSVDKRYKDKLKTYDDSKKAIQTMLASLGDRYTRFLDKEEFKEELQAIDAKLPGIGIQIGLDKSQRIIVIAPIQGTPAFKAGLMPKDEILEVDGTPTKGLSIEEVANKIRGNPGSEVKILVQRGNEKKDFSITRAEIKMEAIPEGQALKVNEKACYIHFSSFIGKDSSDEFASKLKQLGTCEGLILDLRNNPGGLLDNAISIANIFMDDKLDIVSTVDRDGYVITKTTGDKRSIEYKGKLVVLVNEGSASASEILSGALKDQNRAVLVGEKTFGKGLVQLVKGIPDERGSAGGLNITMAKYLTPKGTDIHKIGIEPNYKVKLTEENYKNKQGPWFSDFDNIIDPKLDLKKTTDLQLKKAIEVLNKELLITSTPETNTTVSSTKTEIISPPPITEDLDKEKTKSEIIDNSKSVIKDETEIKKEESLPAKENAK
jgi:carboxyl-terminal processing protease